MLRGPITHRRFSVVLVSATVLAVLAAGVAGWLIRGPGTTTTRTVAPPAYSAASAASGLVYFDGAHAYFAGPAEVRAGTVITIRLMSSVVGASAVVSRMSPAPSWTMLVHDIATANTSPATMPMPYAHYVATVERGNPIPVRLTTPGLYSLWAGPMSKPSSASVALATVVRVTAR